MKITKAFTFFGLFLAVHLLSPCMSKNHFLENIKGKLEEFENNMKKKDFKKKVYISSALLGLTILAHALAGIGYYSFKKNDGANFPDFPLCPADKQKEKMKEEIMNHVCETSEKAMAKKFRTGKEEHPRLKDIITNIENEVKKRNADFDKDYISDMSYDILKNLYHTSELWKKNPDLIPDDK
ncbi:early transcribed membrane protein [Plasmodium ovale]|uniref:Early transcribed membrane protein n=2 Tax=Plasmodium ovale TaxID=36330 RepID=A0A1C3KR22_PLAOA|nr:early transcribed membrane protein [Plasmodium ovale]